MPHGSAAWDTNAEAERHTEKTMLSVCLQQTLLLPSKPTASSLIGWVRLFVRKNRARSSFSATTLVHTFHKETQKERSNAHWREQRVRTQSTCGATSHFSHCTKSDAYLRATCNACSNELLAQVLKPQCTYRWKAHGLHPTPNPKAYVRL